MDRTYPVRKHLRLKNYDYSADGAYFITFCTADRRPTLGVVSVGRDALIPPLVKLSDLGNILEGHILHTPTAYPSITLDHYVIMPNHVHLLLQIHTNQGGGMGASRPTIQRIVKAIKRLTTSCTGFAPFQEGFYDHVIRTESDYLRIWNYIDQNPGKWSEDRYYVEEVTPCRQLKSRF